MRVMMLHKFPPGAAPTGMPTPELMEEMGKLIDDMTRSGKLLATGGFGANSKNVRLTFKRGKMSVTDGPFTEAKEMIAGFGLFDVASMDEAVALAPRFAKLVGDVEIDVRALDDGPAE